MSPPSRCSSRRGWLPQLPEGQVPVPAEELLIDKAQLLTLTAPEMTVLIGGLRVLDATSGSPTRRLHPAARALTNDFFVNLLDMGTEWKPASKDADVFEGRDRKTGKASGPAPGSTSSLVRTPNSGLGGSLRLYGLPGEFVHDFVAAGPKYGPRPLRPPLIVA